MLFLLHFFLLSLLLLFFPPPLPLTFSPLPSSSLFLPLLFFPIISLLLLLLRVTKVRLCPQEQYVYGLSSIGPKMQGKVQRSTLWEIHYYAGNPQGPSLFLLPSPLRGKKWEDWSCFILGHSILGSLGGKSAGSHQGRFHPWQRSCGRDLTGKGGSGLKGPPESARASTPKPKSVCLTILCLSPTLLTLIGGYPWPPFSGKNQLRALVNGHDKSVSIQTPLMAF